MLKHVGASLSIYRACIKTCDHVAIAVQMDVSEVAEEVASSGTGTVHGIIVGQVSPVKTSKNATDVKFFKGQISDGVKTMRLDSFKPLHLVVSPLLHVYFFHTVCA